jgi:DNA-binding transcriptional LysR family regulator
MSRALARLRATTGDPLLVRAGRGLVPTPRAIELREQVGEVVRRAEAMLTPAELPNLAVLVRTFTLRTSEGFVENFGPALIARLAADAPGVRLRFAPKTDKDGTALREGSVDLETGVVGRTTSPELRTQALFRDRFIGAVRSGHELSRSDVTAARYAGGRHVAVSRRGEARGPVDEQLRALGLERDVAIIVGGFATALALARETDLVATVPERHTARLREGMHGFDLPFAMPELTVAMLWHPRHGADPAHRWLRACLREVCAR